MRKLSLTLLAASTMLIAGLATAQPGPGARPGASWRGGGTMGGQMQMRTGGGFQARGGQARTGGGFQAPGGQARTGGGYMVHGGQARTGGGFRMNGGTRGGGHVRGGTWGFHRWGPRPGRNFHHSRLRRGGFINAFWFAPQFFVGNWQAYGFYAPGADQRWVRYYDDAYLIDGGGRVIDERYGVNWNRYGEEWEEQDGIPGYRGAWRDYDDYADEEYSESREDYDDMDGGYGERRGGYEDRGERHESRRDYVDTRDYRGGGRGHGGPMMPPPPGYGPPPGAHGYTNVYGGYGGYGAYAYPIVIETVTTTGGGSYTEEIVEEYVETRRRAHRPRRARCACTRPAPRPVIRRPRPRPGERG